MDILPWILLLLPLASAALLKMALPRAGHLAALAGTFSTAVMLVLSLVLLKTQER